MTDPVPAAAPGLPSFDRRAFLATLAAAGVMGVELPAGAADHPDAGLLALVALHASHSARQQILDLQIDEACHRYDPPPIPEALHWRSSDYMSVCFNRARLAEYVIDGRETHVYEDRRCLGDLADLTALRRADPDQYSLCRGDIARAEELFAAMDAFEAAIAQAEDVAGVTAAIDRAEREAAIIAGLLRGIVLTPARTATGLIAKARVLRSTYASDHEPLDAVPAAMMSGQDIEWRAVLGLSLAIDAANLPDAAPAASSRRSVA